MSNASPTYSGHQGDTQDSRWASRDPPRYSIISVNSSAALPQYLSVAEYDIVEALSSSTPTTQHEYYLGSDSKGKSKPWATLNVSSNAAANSQRPRFVEGDQVAGTIVLDLHRAQAISSIKLIVRGHIVTSSLEEGSYRFLEYTFPVWERSGTSTETKDGKLDGRHEWPFSFPFPTEYTPALSSSSTNNRTTGPPDALSYSVPQTLMERGVDASVRYELVLRIVSGVLKRKYKLQAGVVYIPLIKAPPLPDPRKVAYLNGTYLAGPMEDVAGWTQVASIRTLVSSNHAEGIPLPSSPGVVVNCSVYISNPTAYARATVIPCYLICRSISDDDELVRSFTSQHCVSLRLKQSLEYAQDAQQALAVAVRGRATKSETKQTTIGRKQVVGEAVWWPPQGDGRDSKYGVETRLEGEIHLDHDLYPTCSAPALSVQYTIEVSLLPSQDLSAIIMPYPNEQLSEGVGPGLSYPVTITTAPGDGPLPTPFTPRQKKARKVNGMQQLPDVEFLLPGSGPGRPNFF